MLNVKLSPCLIVIVGLAPLTSPEKMYADCVEPPTVCVPAVTVYDLLTFDSVRSMFKLVLCCVGVGVGVGVGVTVGVIVGVGVEHVPVT